MEFSFEKKKEGLTCSGSPAKQRTKGTRTEGKNPLSAPTEGSKIPTNITTSVKEREREGEKRTLRST
jgi:hypothetical protein